MKVRTAAQLTRFADGTVVVPLDGGLVSGGAPLRAEFNGEDRAAWTVHGTVNGCLVLRGRTADAQYVALDNPGRFAVIGRVA